MHDCFSNDSGFGYAREGLIDSEREKGGEKQREKNREKGKAGTWNSGVTRGFIRSLSAIVEIELNIMFIYRNN